MSALYKNVLRLTGAITNASMKLTGVINRPIQLVGNLTIAKPSSYQNIIVIQQHEYDALTNIDPGFYYFILG